VGTPQEGKEVTIEHRANKVVLKIDAVELTMTPMLARELGDKLYKCGCDVQAQAGT
jgi:hypothetical protein